MKEVLGSLPEVITAYKNYNLLVPTATDVQLNPFYKFHVEEVPVDLGENSGDIFKVGSVKTGKQDERGRDIWEDVFSLSKPLLNKMAMAAGIQFNPKETYGERIDRVTYRAQAQGAMRKADGTARTETDQKVICLEDEEEKYRIEFADKAAKGITDEKQAQAAAEIFSGQWVESKNKWGKKCQAFVVAKEDRDRYIERSVMVNMALLKKTWAEKAKGPVVDGVNLRSQDTVKCLEYMVQVAIEEKPDIVCVSGDIFHQEQVGPVRYSDEMITATNIITSLAHFSKYVIVMRGTPNHDGAAQFRVLERMLLNIRNVDVVTEPGVIKTPWADIACLPGFDKQEFRAKFPGLSADEENLAWTKYISDMVFALRAECEKTPILMAHYTVPGCNMESGQTSFFTNFEPVIPREALMAARYEAVLLGHIHRPQIIEGLDNVFYSGAINAMNFNDEGQDRGFWIHEFNEKGTLVKGHKCTTPYRQFHTITWDPDEAGDYIREGAMYLHRTGISEDVTDKIVRVRYSCTSEQKKALNIPLLQKNLYELGAFYVADIEAESTIDITNRGLLSEESDPRLNLKKWLEEKTFKNPDKIVELSSGTLHISAMLFFCLLAYSSRSILFALTSTFSFI